MQTLDDAHPASGLENTAARTQTHRACVNIHIMMCSANELCGHRTHEPQHNESDVDKRGDFVAEIKFPSDGRNLRDEPGFGKHDNERAAA